MTNSELAILSLISERPLHGYEIEQVIDSRGMREWTEVGFSSIYYILKKLEDQGMIRGRAEPPRGKGPGRKVYRLTPAGRTAWRRAALTALATPVRLYSPFQVGLSNLPLIPTPDAIQALREYSRRLDDRREHVRNRLNQAGDKLPFHAAAMFDLSLTLLEAELTWVRRFTRSLSSTSESRQRNEQTRPDQVA